MSNKKERLLSVGEAAERLGVTVDVARSLADSGDLPLARTGGGHRRFESADVDALKARWSSRGKKSRPVKSATQKAFPARRVTQPPPRAVKFDPEPWDISDDPYERQMARQAEEMRLAEQRKRHEEAAAAEERRLAEFRDYGEARLLGIYDVPTAVKAQALVEVQKWVTSTTIPKGLSAWAARQLVENQVDFVLKPHYDAVARAKKKEEDARKVEQLIRDGNSYALSETFGWSWDEQKEAREDVERELRRQVNSGWTPADVKELVDDVLDDGDDDDGDDDNDDDDDGNDRDDGREDDDQGW